MHFRGCGALPNRASYMKYKIPIFLIVTVVLMSLRQSRQSLGPTQPPIELETEFFPVGKAAGE
jgi:hypothetical protein